MSREKFGSLGGPSIRTLLLREALRCSERSDSADTTDAYDTAKMYREMCTTVLQEATNQHPQRTDLANRLICEHDDAVEAGRQ